MESVPLKQTQVQTRVNEFIRSVYNWMAIGLALTGFTAYYVANTPALVQAIFGNQLLFFGLIIGELALVFYISARIQKIQASTATALFVVYSVLNGATLSFRCPLFSWFIPLHPLLQHFLSAPPPLWPAAYTGGPPNGI
jgi:FtsH-binding integral membrane protein